ncbi:DNA polymerase III subunit delta [Bacillus aerolatus]|uniref:DNA polymerase III subunit delta n=1 Tax=Bacillus aerolatus TaxID=2653354 RepID=A0A6I1FKQ4_9BACI|nr:DNA polymerase III subunit delta [Bacillus aerolatus]
MPIWKDIEKKQFSPIYLLYGTEAFLINETKQKLIQSVLTEEEMDFNFSVYDLEEMPVETAIEEAETFPFMGEKKLVILHNPVFLTAERSKDKVDHNVKKLEEYLANPAPYTILVVAAPYEKLDERKKITKLLKKSAAVMEANKLNDKDLKIWLRGRAAANQVQIDEEALDHFLVIAGTDLMMLASELDKLSLYAQDEQRITVEVVDKLTARSLEQDIFALVDRVVTGKVEEAFRIYYDLLKLNEEPIKILAVIANQFRLIYQTKELARKGYGQQQMASFLKVHPFRVKLAAGQSRNFSDEQLAAIIMLLADSDLQMKTSGMAKPLIVEMFLFKLQSLMKKTG